MLSSQHRGVLSLWKAGSASFILGLTLKQAVIIMLRFDRFGMLLPQAFLKEGTSLPEHRLCWFVGTQLLVQTS